MARWLVGNSRAARRIDALAVRLPDSDPWKTRARSTIAALGEDCGCSMGGAFFGVAAVAAIAVLLASGMPGAGALLLAIAAVIGAGFVGKLVGLGVARARLIWLGRSIRSRIASVETAHVHVY